jgi:hypothetical protein
MNHAASDQETLDVVLFSAGGWRVGFEARQVRASRPAPADAAGDEVEMLLGFSPSETCAPRQHLLLKHEEGDRQILVGSPVDLVSFSIHSIHPLPPLLAARTTLHSLRALAITEDKTLVLLFGAAP